MAVNNPPVRAQGLRNANHAHSHNSNYDGGMYLSLESVGVRYAAGRAEHAAVESVSLSLAAGRLAC